MIRPIRGCSPQGTSEKVAQSCRTAHQQPTTPKTTNYIQSPDSTRKLHHISTATNFQKILISIYPTSTFREVDPLERSEHFPWNCELVSFRRTPQDVEGQIQREHRWGTATRKQHLVPQQSQLFAMILRQFRGGGTRGRGFLTLTLLIMLWMIGETGE